jgi:DNA-binding transcriptional LysR family regulator
VDVAVSPRLSSDNLLVLREAALAGCGVAPMATLMCSADVAAGRLQIVAPGWAPPPAQLYAVYGSRRTLSVAGRAFIEGFEGFLREVYGVV